MWEKGDHPGPDSIDVFVNQVNEKLLKNEPVFFVIDNRATNTIVPNTDLLHDRKPTLMQIQGVDGLKTTLDSEGTLKLLVRDIEGNQHSLKLEQSFEYNKCPMHLMSINNLIDRGMRTIIFNYQTQKLNVLL